MHRAVLYHAQGAVVPCIVQVAASQICSRTLRFWFLPAVVLRANSFIKLLLCCCTTGKKGSAARPSREDAQDDFDEAMSTTSWDTNDTYGSAIDNGGQQESYYINGGGARSDTGSVADVGESKAVDDFKDAVELLTEKR